MRIYIARSNKIDSLQFERAKRIIQKDCELLGIDPILNWHDKLNKYEPGIIEKADIVFFITVADNRRIGRGLAQQFDQCKKNNIPAYHLIINNVGGSLQNRKYQKISHIEINKVDEYDERHATIFTYPSSNPESIYKYGLKVKPEKKTERNEVDEISEDDIQAAADLYDEIVSKESLYINSLKTNKENGNIIEVQRLVAQVERGKKRGGHTVHGRGSSAITQVGHLSHGEISGLKETGEKSINRKRRL